MAAQPQAAGRHAQLTAHGSSTGHRPWGAPTTSASRCTSATFTLSSSVCVAFSAARAPASEELRASTWACSTATCCWHATRGSGSAANAAAAATVRLAGVVAAALSFLRAGGRRRNRAAQYCWDSAESASPFPKHAPAIPCTWRRAQAAGMPVPQAVRMRAEQGGQGAAPVLFGQRILGCVAALQLGGCGCRRTAVAGPTALAGGQLFGCGGLGAGGQLGGARFLGYSGGVELRLAGGHLCPAGGQLGLANRQRGRHLLQVPAVRGQGITGCRSVGSCGQGLDARGAGGWVPWCRTAG